MENKPSLLPILLVFGIFIIFLIAIAATGFFGYKIGFTKGKKTCEETETNEDRENNNQSSQDDNDVKINEPAANARNSSRINDISMLRVAISQWLAKEEENYEAEVAYKNLGVTEELDPTDGISDSEGVAASQLFALIDSNYLIQIPTDPNGKQYRVGVDNKTDPTKLFICTNDIENTSQYSKEDYPNGVFCYSI